MSYKQQAQFKYYKNKAHHQLDQNQSQYQQHAHQNQQLLSPSQFVLFSRINNHLLFHYVPLEQFWSSSRLCVTIKQFQKMLQKIKFNKGKQQFQELRQQGVQFISLDKILAGVNEWKHNYNDIVTFFEKQKQYLATHKHEAILKSQKQSSTSSPNKIKAKSKVFNGILQLNSNTQLKSQRKNQLSQTNSNKSRVTMNSSHLLSANYLVEQSQKQKMALSQLNSTLIRTKNQSHYELTIKIGQLNDICKKLKNDISYIIVTKQNNQMQIFQRSSKSGHQKAISQKAFQKRYHELKTLNNNMMQEIEGTLQKDLRQTLVEVMFLSDELQKQIGLLKRKGVNC